MLHLHNISLTYADGTAALENFTIEINRGILGLLGAEKSGKTSLLRILSAEITPNSGEVYLNENNLHDLGNKNVVPVGYLPQVFGFYKNKTIKAQLWQLAKLKGFRDGTRIEKAVSTVMDLFLLTDKSSLRISECNLFEERTIGLAQSFLGNPELVILDEPFEALSSEESTRLKNILVKLGRDKIIILATRRPMAIEDLCDRILLLEQGRIIYYGSPDLANQPLSRELSHSRY